MSWDKARVPVQIVIVLVVAGLVVGRLTRRGQPRHAARPPAPYVHPIVPSEPVVNPPPRNCRVPDLQMASAGVAQTRMQVALAEARRRRGQTCRDDADMRAIGPQIDVLAQEVDRCVAQDAQLDAAWNLVQSAIMALRTCADCAAEPPARQKGCDRTRQLIAEADRARRQVTDGK
jgi:hypothetical protein